jgi:hypothetical protein
MKKFKKYDPEDIESLLLNKKFSELYDEERVFVLKHISSEQEYELLRKTLLNVTGTVTSEENDDLVPSPYIKRQLLEEVGRNAPARGFWLNAIGFLRMIEIRPAFRITVASVVVLVVTVFLVRDYYLQDKRGPADRIAVKNEGDPSKQGPVPGESEKAAPGSPAKDEPSPQSTAPVNPPVVKKSKEDQQPKKNKDARPQLSPAMASRSLAQDEALEGFLFEVL